MAIEILEKSDTNHHPRHDMESILYVIIYICTFTDGPNLIRRKGNQDICAWFEEDKSLQDIAQKKMIHMLWARDHILPGITEYWRDFAPFLQELILSAFPGSIDVHTCPPNSLSYRSMISILSRAQDVVQEPSIKREVKVGRKQSSLVKTCEPSRDEGEPLSKRSRRLMSPVD